MPALPLSAPRSNVATVTPVSYDPHADRDPASSAPDDTAYVGVLGGGTALYYDDATGSFLRGDPDGEDDAGLERLTGYEVGAEDRLGAVLEEIGDDLGWESLSEFARDHLEGRPGDR